MDYLGTEPGADNHSGEIIARLAKVPGLSAVDDASRADAILKGAATITEAKPGIFRRKDPGSMVADRVVNESAKEIGLAR